MPAQHDYGPGNGPRCRRCNALDESTNLGVGGEALVERADDYHEKIYRQEYTEGGGARAGHAVDEVPDESNGDHNRAGCNHGYGHGIKKLCFSQPVVFLDHASMQERHNCQAAAKYK